jgi:hypothetical protein
MSMTMFESYFGEQPAQYDAPLESGEPARLELGPATFQSLLTVAGILEHSACSEAAVRLAAMALRRALDCIVCVPGGKTLS